MDRGSTADVGFSCIGKLVCNLMLDSGCSAGDRGSMFLLCHSSTEAVNLTSFQNPVALYLDRRSTADVGFSCIGELVCDLLMLESGCSAGDRGSMLYAESF